MREERNDWVKLGECSDGRYQLTLHTSEENGEEEVNLNLIAYGSYGRSELIPLTDAGSKHIFTVRFCFSVIIA